MHYLTSHSDGYQQFWILWWSQILHQKTVHRAVKRIDMKIDTGLPACRLKRRKKKRQEEKHG